MAVSSEPDESNKQANGSAASEPSSCLYRDYSREPVEDTISLKKDSVQNFPMKLHSILSNSEFSDIISWLPHGRAWRILQHKAFEERVIPLFFRHGRYSSFARQVNGWGFKRISSGPDYNSYYHELFLRGLPHLSQRMKRVSTKDGKKTEPPNSDGDQPVPDFYAISREHPVPDLPNDQHNRSKLATLPVLQHSAKASHSTLDLPQPGLTGLMMPNAASASNVPEELALLEQRRRELLLLQLATLQGSAQTNPQMSLQASVALPPTQTPQLDLNGANQLMALLGQYGVTMASNPAPAALAPAPLAPAGAMQQLWALQQQLAAGTQTSATGQQTGPLPSVSLESLLNQKQPSMAANQAPTPTIYNMSNLAGVNLQSLVGNSNNNPVAALQQLLNNANGSIQQAYGSDGHTQPPALPAPEIAGIQQNSPSFPSAEEVQKLLQAASSGNGSVDKESIDNIKRQVGALQTSSGNTPPPSHDWQQQLGRAAAMSNGPASSSPMANMVNLLAQIQRQTADNGLETQQQDINGPASSVRGSSGNTGDAGTNPQVPDFQRLLANGNNANELLNLLLGNSGRRDQ